MNPLTTRANGETCFVELEVGLYEAQVLSAAQSRHLADVLMGEAGWEWATITRGSLSNIVDPAVRTAEVLRLSGSSPLLEDIRELLVGATEKLAGLMAGVATTLADFQLIRYQCGGFFRVHRDNPEFHSNRRVVTVLCYLNEDFEGGGLLFPELSFTYRPRAGAVVVFPSTYSHCAEAVYKGCKLAITAWHLRDDCDNEPGSCTNPEQRS